MEDTIAAISTTMGVGAISIIRVSGNDSIKIVSKIFKGQDLNSKVSHTITYGHIVENNKIIDEVLVSIMRAPKTFTKENIVEINAHGGIATTQKILEILLNNGCRLAEPGEFTKRAFLNGRIDLLEAEGVMDLINSKTEKEREIAINELNGTTSKMIKDLRHQILEINANIKVNIDYPEYNDIKEITNNEILEQVSSIENKLKRILEESQDGKLIKEGITATIIGKPNVGKSSILNKLLDEEKAIVTDIAGTTRDIVEGSITISGIKINFLDTAGIRETKNIVENIGVKKSLELIDKSDLILYVLNNNEQLTKEDLELLDKIKNKNHIIIINKIDLPKKIDISMMGNENIIYISALNDDGAFLIKEEIKKLFNFEKFNDKDLTYLTNARTISLIKKAINEFSNVKNSLNMQVPIDMVEIDLEQVAETLGCITGENYSEDLINQMFSNFCLGK